MSEQGFFGYNASRVWIDDGSVWVELDDGRKASLPVSSFKRLANSTLMELQSFEIIGGYAIHWPGLDEDLSVAGFFTSSLHAVQADVEASK